MCFIGTSVVLLLADYDTDKYCQLGTSGLIFID